jgi:hypothetical protein
MKKDGTKKWFWVPLPSLSLLFSVSSACFVPWTHFPFVGRKNFSRSSLKITSLCHFLSLSLSLYNRLFYLSLPNDDLFDDDDDKEEEVKKKIYKKCPHPLPLMRL